VSVNPINRTYTKATRKPTPSNTFEHYELEKYRNSANNNGNVANSAEYIGSFPNDKPKRSVNQNPSNPALTATNGSSSSNTYDFNLNNYIIQQHHLNLNYHQSNLNRKINEINRKSFNNFNNSALRQSANLVANYDTFLKYTNLANNPNGSENGSNHLISKRNSNIVTTRANGNSANTSNNRSTQIFNV
jgi:hypothetical protein